MASEDVKNLATMMGLLLSRLETLGETYDMDLPERRYWTMGTPVDDCEQVVVSFVQMYIGPPGDEATSPQRCNSPRTAVMQVAITRCIPVVTARGHAPSPTDIQAASERLAWDAYFLLEVSLDLDTWSDVFPGLGIIATVEVGEAQGGFQSTIMSVTTAIP